MATRTQFQMLPLDKHTTTAHTKLSETITVACTHCHQTGFACVVTGWSEYPIYKCQYCGTVAQSILAVGKARE
jgi:hypothetical protein